MRRRVERRYLTQLTKGCGKAWCRNAVCKTGRLHVNEVELGIKEATVFVKPLLAALDGPEGKFSFCVDEAAQERRDTANLFAEDEGGYALGWWVAALETCGGDVERGRAWLEKWAAPRNQA
jgi:hypothetical protein